MTKPHFSTISSSNSHEIQESTSKGLNYIPKPGTKHSGPQILLARVRLAARTEPRWLVSSQRNARTLKPTSSHHLVTHPEAFCHHHIPRRNLITTFTRICYEELLGFTTIQSPYDHRFQEDDFTPLLHDKTLDLHKVSEYPYAEARQFAVVFPGKSTSLSLTIHRNRNLSQFVQEFLGWRFSTEHVDQAQT